MIWIDPYYRVRFGKLESVKGHWRPLPQRTLLALATPTGARLP